MHNKKVDTPVRHGNGYRRHTSASTSIGVVGGMGKEATNEFLQLLSLAVTALGFKDTEKYMPAYFADNTEKPDRSEYLLNKQGAISPAPAIIEGCNGLAQSGAKIIFMPCNTAHAQIDEIRSGSSVPVISLVELTHSYILKHYPGAYQVGLLATDGTVFSKKVYHPVFENPEHPEDNINIIVPDQYYQNLVMQGIYDKKNGVKVGRARDTTLRGVRPAEAHPTIRFAQAYNSLLKKLDSDPKIIIAGCTEVPLAFFESDSPEGSILIDPVKIAALAAVIIRNDYKFLEYLIINPDTSKWDKDQLLSIAMGAMERRPITPQDLAKLATLVEEKHSNRSKIDDLMQQAGVPQHIGNSQYPKNSPSLSSQTPSDSDGTSEEDEKVPEKENSPNKSEKLKNTLTELKKKYDIITEKTVYNNNPQKSEYRICFNFRSVESRTLSEPLGKELKLYLSDQLSLTNYDGIRLHGTRNMRACSITMVANDDEKAKEIEKHLGSYDIEINATKNSEATTRVSPVRI